MQYARILSLIDAELHRLRKARQLISIFDAPSDRIRKSKGKKPQETISPPPVRPLAAETAENEAPTAISRGFGLRPDALAIKKTKRSTRREGPAGTPQASAPPRPLGGVIPEGPVFVSADQIRKAQAERKVGQTPDQRPSGAADAYPPTAEVLRQKWLQALSS
jgi:hypothetical protein